MLSKPIQAIVVLIVSLWTFCAWGQQASRYVRSDNSGTVIVFVHGVLGDGANTWRKGSTFWPELVSKDTAFSGADIFVLEYATSLWATMSIDELAENMRLQLSGHGVTPRDKLVFVAHSMGGLIVRKYLLKNRDVAGRTKMIYFFSTPTEGSQVASLATLITRAPQLGGMQPMKSADYLADLLRDWLSAEFGIPSYCAYEKRRTFGLEVVTLPSASNLCTKRLDPIDADHLDIVKPSGTNDTPHLALKTAYKEQMEIPSGLRSKEAARDFERILVALNMTLMRNREDLFPQIDQYIANPSESSWRSVTNTARSMLDEISNAVKRSMEFDAQFYQVGNNIILIAGDARQEAVDRNFNQPFKTVRPEWQNRSQILREIIEIRNMPTSQQARDWRALLVERYSNLSRELERLVQLVRAKT